MNGASHYSRLAKYFYVLYKNTDLFHIRYAYRSAHLCYQKCYPVFDRVIRNPGRCVIQQVIQFCPDVDFGALIDRLLPHTTRASANVLNIDREYFIPTQKIVSMQKHSDSLSKQMMFIVDKI